MACRSTRVTESRDAISFPSAPGSLSASAVRVAALCLAVLSLHGCAHYHVGRQTLFPPDVTTVYVPMFESDSYRRNLGERLTEAVIKQIELQTPYKVVGTPDADSVLSGRIVGDAKRIVVQNGLDEGRQVEVTFDVRVSWVTRRGEFIRQEQGVPLPPQLVNMIDRATLVPEGGQSIATAQQRVIDQLAAQIVGMMETPW